MRNCFNISKTNKFDCVFVPEMIPGIPKRSTVKIRLLLLKFTLNFCEADRVFVAEFKKIYQQLLRVWSERFSAHKCTRNCS
jgi:hypothetical protein